jgi:hypothetical protein
MIRAEPGISIFSRTAAEVPSRISRRFGRNYVPKGSPPEGGDTDHLTRSATRRLSPELKLLSLHAQFEASQRLADGT